MAKVRPLTPREARHTLANRFIGLADRLRQLNTRFGIRPYRVFLTWVRWSGETRGEGQATIFAQTEILPTPLVQSMDKVSLSFFAGGVIPIGSVQVSEVSGRFTQDELMGHVYRSPTGGDGDGDRDDRRYTLLPLPGAPNRDHIPEPFEFKYWIREDGRGDDPAYISEFRLLNVPMRYADDVQWKFMLERIAQDPLRDGTNAIGLGVR